jgi:hypothetical protein
MSNTDERCVNGVADRPSCNDRAQPAHAAGPRPAGEGRPPTAPRSEYPGACVVSLGSVHLPLVSSGLLSFGLFHRALPA